MQEFINSLDDPTAIRVLGVIAHHKYGAKKGDDVATDSFKNDLAGEFAVQAGTGSVTDGDIARQTLLLLSTEDGMEQTIRGLAADSGAKSKAFGIDPVSIGVGVVALIVLQSHIEFKLGPDGKKTIHFKKKPLNDSLLKSVVEKVLSWVPSGPFA